MKKRLRRVILPGLAVVLSACVTYARVEGPVPLRNAEVVVTPKTPVDVLLGEITVHDVTRMEGRVAYADGDSVVLAARRFVTAVGTDYPSAGSPVTIVQDQIATLRRKRVSGWRTGLALGASGAALAAIVTSVGSLAGSGGGGRPKPQP